MGDVQEQRLSRDHCQGNWAERTHRRMKMRRQVRMHGSHFSGRPQRPEVEGTRLARRLLPRASGTGRNDWMAAVMQRIPPNPVCVMIQFIDLRMTLLHHLVINNVFGVVCND